MRRLGRGTACTAMYRPAQLKDSNMISAVFSRFSGGFRGCMVVRCGPE